MGKKGVMMLTPAEARERRGLSRAQLATAARIGESYLARIERHGFAPFVLARRLSKILNVPLDVFLSGSRDATHAASRSHPARCKSKKKKRCSALH